MAKNRDLANKGKAFEQQVKWANESYNRDNIALIQHISVPWIVVRSGANIVSAFPEGKSTLDFRGTIIGGVSISFDCKETLSEKGLPLSNIEDHQIEYMKKAMMMGEITFILCSMKTLGQRYFIPGHIVIDYWEAWKNNPNTRGYNTILVEDMIEVFQKVGITIDYLEPLGLEQTKKYKRTV